MRRVSVSNITAVLVALWVGAYCSGCALPPADPPPEPPTIVCMNFGQVPGGSAWWIYVCTFEGDTILTTEPRGPTTA